LLSFYEREPVRYDFRYKEDSRSRLKYSNLSDYMSGCLFLTKQGYGSLKEIKEMDTPEFLDCLEYEKIHRTIEAQYIKEAQNGQ